MMTPLTRHRIRWAAVRKILEKKPVKKGVFEGHGIRVDTLSKLAAACLEKTPVYSRGFKNAAHPKLVRQRLFFSNLPDAFDGYTILHLTDLHLDSVPGLVGRTVSLIRDLMKADSPDVCLMTGDYIDRHARGDYASITGPMKEICSAMTLRDGIFAILGNHDTWKMAAPFQAMGIHMLINETAQIHRGGDTISVTGVDDPNHFYTPDADRALKDGGEGFKIALIHTPELYREAAENGYDLYLTGHTHGGQISLPGGRPVILPLTKGKQFYRGVWQVGAMTGYTGQGLGTVSIPIRFNTFSEVTLIELRKGRPGTPRE